MHENVGAKLIVTNDSYVFEPGNATSAASELESLTIKFSDGSFISLVGQHVAMQHVLEIVG